ncbi:unnamed protein product [Agarophyton chilense]|eukprot:gb/GEZJ01002171.1/.p1 GENE.gb/GEZJ01002171.1/~~gb/GEZJ01002171.1/.p1  ORF type:complete len:1165 (+),score=202.42 gb/GEZJ01002171.1/:246-3740(+)
MDCGSYRIQAFIPPNPAMRSFREGFMLCRPPHRQHHTFRKTPLRSRMRTLSRLGLPSHRIVAVQTSPVSGDNDGELHEEQPSPQKSYSVGVTIVSGYDASLRRRAIEQISAEFDAGRLVVVTSGGITSTEEPDSLQLEEVGSDRLDPEPCVNNEGLTHDVSDNEPHDSDDSESNLDNSLGDASGNLLHRMQPAIRPEGWISCSSTDEMAEVIAKLATSRECDYILAEGSMNTNMEPQDFARLFRNRAGASLRVDTLVSVVDGNMLLKDLSGMPALQGEETLDEDAVRNEESRPRTNYPEGIQDLSDTRPMTVVSLVENANVVVVRQTTSSSGSEDISRARELVSVLNGTADIVSVTDEQLPVDKMVNTNTYDHESVLLGATWKRVLLATRNTSNVSPRHTLPKSLKDSAFVYRARRPFHPTRLYAQIKAVATFTGVIRSTGRIWLATRMLAPLEWNQAGVSATLRVGDLFWAAVPEENWPANDVQRKRIIEDWDTQYGDRETEIVFIGKGIDKLRLQGLLDGCLLQDEEMVFNNMWENFDDPFVEWVPLIEDDEELTHENEGVVPKHEPQEEESSLGQQLTNEDDVIQPETESISFETDVREESGIVDLQESLNEEQLGPQLDDSISSSGSEGQEKQVKEDPPTELSEEKNETKIEPSTPGTDRTKGLIVDEPKLGNTTTESYTVSQSGGVEGESEPISVLSNSQGPESAANGADGGQVEYSDLSEEVLDRVSALDMFEDAILGNKSSLQPLPRNSRYDEDEAIIASWDGSVADGILKQVPKSGLPVTVVTGFLGSGKTTLLNYILKEDHGLRIAVLVNEFGEIDIDNQLVEKGNWSNKDEVMELANGCICCNINDSFLTAVSKILERSEDVDYLIVETTGLADPVPVINSLMVSDIADYVRVDGILTVVDVDNFDPESFKSEAVLSQIMAADTILLSKTDVAAPEQTQKTIDYVKSVRPAARILRSQNGRVPINMILDVGVRVADSPTHLNPVNSRATEKEEEMGDEDESRISSMEGVCSNQTNTHEHIIHHHEHSHDYSRDQDEHMHDCGPACTHESHKHDHHNHLEIDGFVTTSFKSEKSLDPEMFMKNFLQKLPEGVFRAKGLLRFHGYPGRYVFQLSGRRYQLEEDEWPEGVEPGSQLVIIGRDLDLEKLKTTLGECIV